MVKRYRLLVACVLLFVTNGWLYSIWRGGVTDLSITHFQLKDNSGLDAYIKNPKNNFEDIQYLLREKGGKALLEASQRFSEKIHALLIEQNSGTGNEASPIVYFNESLSIDKKSQDDLASAQREFQEVVTQFLEIEVAAFREQSKAEKERAEDQLAVMKNAATGRQNGSRWSEPLRLPTGGSINIRWSKENDSIFWDSGQQLFQRYMNALERHVDPPHAIQSKNLIMKLSRTFVTPGKMEVYGKVYDLSRITRVELESVCGHIAILKARTERCILLTAREMLFIL
ncbi:hypothetical protein BH10BAC4_BH10BAC4_15380 [soil metagenome]